MEGQVLTMVWRPECRRAPCFFLIPAHPVNPLDRPNRGVVY